MKYLIPPFLFDTLRFLKAILQFLPFYKKTIKNRKFENIKRNNTVYVIANGPSLNNFDINSLFGQEVIVMNNFNLAKWKDNVNIVAHCIGEPKSSAHWGRDQIEIMNGTDAQSYWFHISVVKDVERSNIKNEKCYFVNSIIPSGLFRNGGKIDLAAPVLGYQTTAQMAIMVALYMGYKKIYLLGFDHDWLSNRTVSPHFYKEQKGVRKSDLSAFSYYELITFSQNMWNIYLKIQRSALRAKSEIINLSKPSYLDVFKTE